MGLNTEPHAFCTLAQSRVSFSPWSFPPFSPFACSQSHYVKSLSSLFCFSLLVPYYSNSVPQVLCGFTSRIYTNKHWPPNTEQTRLTTNKIPFKLSQFMLLCPLVSIYMHCTCRKSYTHWDNLSTNSNRLISGKCQILSICEGTCTHTFIQRENMAIRGFSCLKFEKCLKHMKYVTTWYPLCCWLKMLICKLIHTQHSLLLYPGERLYFILSLQQHRHVCNCFRS